MSERPATTVRREAGPFSASIPGADFMERAAAGPYARRMSRISPAHALLALAIVAVWGTNFVVIRLVLDELPPLLVATLRFLLALLPAMFFLPRPRVPLANLAGYGLLIGAGQFGLLYLAIDGRISPGLASLVVQTQVFFTIGLAMWLAGERIRGYQAVAVLVAAAGSPTPRATGDPAGRHPRAILFWPGTGRTIRPPLPSAGRGRSSAPPGCGPAGRSRPGLAEHHWARPPRRTGRRGCHERVFQQSRSLPSGVPAERVAAGLARQPRRCPYGARRPGCRVRPADLLQARTDLGVQTRVAAALRADQRGHARMPACYLAVRGHGGLAARSRRAAIARLTRPRTRTGTLSSRPQPRVTGNCWFLRYGNGRQTASAAGTACVIHQVPRGRQLPGTAGVWSSTTQRL